MPLDRLCYVAGRGGIAKRKGVTVSLASPPDLGHGTVVECDHVPALHLHRVRREPSGPIDDMLPDEIARADALLRDAVPTVPGAL